MGNNKKLLNYFFSLIITILLAVIGVKAWDGLTARDGDNLDYQKWNSLIGVNPTGIPSGFVVAFDGETCPAGWTRFSDADRRVIIGASDTTYPEDVSTGKPALPARSFRSVGGSEYPPVDTNAISVDIRFVGSGTTIGSSVPSDTATFLGGNLASSLMFSSAITNSFSLSGAVFTNTQRDWASKDNMQPYIALVYCKKD